MYKVGEYVQVDPTHWDFIKAFGIYHEVIDICDDNYKLRALKDNKIQVWWGGYIKPIIEREVSFTCLP